MKTLILLKTYPDTQLAHLYEHLFCKEVQKFFYNHGLFKYLDYFVSGTTYSKGGIIEITLEFYTSEATALSEKIYSLPLLPETRDLHIGLTQILNEEERIIGTYLPAEGIIEKLKDIHTIKWQDIDNFDAYDTKGTHQKHQVIRIEHNRQLRIQRLKANLVLNKDFASSHRKLLPLFHVLAKSILYVWQNELSQLNGYYGDGLIHKQSHHKIYVSAVLKVASIMKDSVDLKRDQQKCFMLLSTMTDSNAFTRLVKDLQNISYTHHSNIAPNIDAIIEITELYVGANGWKRLATLDNIELLLNQSSIELEFNKEKVSQQISIKF